MLHFMSCQGLLTYRGSGGYVSSVIDSTALLTLRAEDRVAVAGRSGDGRLLRGTGDLLVADAATGTKRLSGRRVTLSDGNNTHVASGSGAAVVLDNKNNARVFGAVQQTVSTRIHEQIEKNKQKKEQ